MNEAKNAAHYPVWKQFLLGCAERPGSPLLYRVWALFHLFVGYPLVVAPAFYQVFIADKVIPGFPQFMHVAQIVWVGLHILLLLTIVSMAWLTRPGASKEGHQSLPTLTAVAVVCDLVTTLVFALQVGFLNSAPHFVIFTIIVLTRVFYPYRVAAAGTLSVVLTLVLVVSALMMNPELARVIPEAQSNLVSTRGEILSTGLLLLALIVALFVGVNYIVNQRNILQRYLTEQVLNRYLPPKLVEQAEVGSLSFDHEPERKVLTVMFADLVGFTALSEKLGADGVGKVINRYLGELSDIAHYHGGTIDKFVGDCIMVFFGAPDPMTPQAQAYRCIEMARHIHERIAEIDWEIPLKVRVGIATGEVVVGHFGSSVRSDYTVIGPTVNLAARLETQCKAGCILVSEGTATLIGDTLPLEKTGPMSLKGVGEKVYAYELGV